MTDRRSFLTAIAGLPLLPSALTGTAHRPTGPLAHVDKPRMPSEIRATGESFWRELRKEFTLNRDETFFNTGTLGASPKAVQEAVIDHMRHVDRDIAQWDYYADHENYFTGYYPELTYREKLAAIIGAKGHDVALCQNATFGMNFLANGLELAPGDEVVATNQDHPGGRKGFDLRAKRQGIVVKEILLPDPATDLTPDQLVDLYLGQTTPQTRLWAIPHINSGRATRFPVERLCAAARERGIFSAIDGAQSLGHLAIDVNAMGCDAIYGSPHKWLLAPKGTGMLWVRPEKQQHLWATLASAGWDDPNDRMYALMQYGTGNLSLLVGLGVACDFHQQIGSQKIQDRIVGMGDQLRAGVKAIPGSRIISPTHPQLTCASTVYGLSGKTGNQIQDFLWNRAKIRVRSVGDIGVRHTCHIYNSPADVDRTLGLLTELARS
ncbi:MAG: aminotransferase class V-fold PLP-dependent enzyme [Gemmatimonadales bacterium]